MDYIIFDYESYYDSDYSLKKLPTHAYIRDPRWQCLGVAWYRGSWRKHSPVFTPGDAVAAQVNAFPTDVPWVGHNLAFDASVALHHHIHKHRQPRQPVMWCDTMLMARYCIAQGILPPDLRVNLKTLAEHFGLEAKGDTAAAVAAGGEDLAAYAIHDVRLTDTIFRKLLPHVPRFEMQLIDLHIRMTADPVLCLDEALLHEEIEANRLDPKIKAALGSSEKFALILKRLGVEPETKTSPRTGKSTYAFAKTDGFMRDLLSHDNALVRKLAELRLKSKSNLALNRARRILDIGEPLPNPALYYGAHTGRPTGTEGINLKNLPRGGRIRRAIKAPPGHKFVICDSGQIEVRVLGWRAGEGQLLDICRRADRGEGPDVYTEFAVSVMFPGTDTASIAGEQRRIAKAPVLAAGYGQGEEGQIQYAAGMGIHLSREQARRGVQGYRGRWRNICGSGWGRDGHWGELMAEIRRTGVTRLPSERLLTYPDLRYEGRQVYFSRAQIFSKQYVGRRDQVKLWHGLACENSTQAIARDVVYWQMLEAEKAGQGKWRIVLDAYDEGVFLVPEDHAEECMRVVLAAFATVPSWAEGLPTVGEAVIADDYGEKP